MMNLDSPSLYTDISGLGKLKLSAREQAPDAIKKVAGQFESVFLNMMMKSMRQAKLSEGILDTQQSNFYRDMYDQQLTMQLAEKPGLGLADFIVKQLSPKQVADANKGIDTYLNQSSLNPFAGVPTNATGQPPALSKTSEYGNAMDASGLASLERTLAALEKFSLREVKSVQGQNDEWQTLKTGGTQPIGTKQEFMQQLLPHARQAASELGVDANLLIAQAALETGWGQGVIKNGQGESSFNLFNIKADKSWQGKQTKTLTVEMDGGVVRKEVAGFRSYASYKHSFDDYVSFIKSNPRYSEALKKAANPVQYIYELQQAGYATDPKYAEKIINIYNAQRAENNSSAKAAG